MSLAIETDPAAVEKVIAEMTRAIKARKPEDLPTVERLERWKATMFELSRRAHFRAKKLNAIERVLQRTIEP
jgi:hypothetical protein